MTEVINFNEYSDEQKQAWADMILHEIDRHNEDIKRAMEELKWIEKHHGIKPRTVLVGKWVEILNQRKI